jgi:peptidoglycan hydrolase-like protein with peptidoglycan-binding domain
MHGREPEGDPSLDDWFAEPERTGRQRRREAERSPGTEDWTEEHVFEREPGYRLPQLTRPEAKIGLAVAALAVVLLIGLAAGGVFSSGGKKATPPTTTAGTRTHQTTTQSKPAAAFAVPAHQLKPGAKGADVTKLQKALIKLGYLTGKADGAYGPATEAALKSYQQVTGLTADGILGPKTITALKRSATSSSSASTSSTTFDAPTHTLAPGDTGGQVLVLQRELSGLGYAIGAIDGTYGSKTVAAVKAFQQANGLSADGVVGSKTLQALATKATSG